MTVTYDVLMRGSYHSYKRLELPENITLEQSICWIIEQKRELRLPEYDLLMESFSAAINSVVCAMDTILHEGDTVLLFPLLEAG